MSVIKSINIIDSETNKLEQIIVKMEHGKHYLWRKKSLYRFEKLIASINQIHERKLTNNPIQ